MSTYMIQILMAFLGTVGFSIFFNIRKIRLLLVGIGGALGWAAFLLINYCTQNEVVALFLASVLVSAMAEVLARVVKTPGTVLLIPMLIAEIPGGNLFYTMSNLVQGKEALFQSYLKLVLKEAAAIAVGIMVVTSIMQIIRKLGEYNRKKTKIQKV